MLLVNPINPIRLYSNLLDYMQTYYMNSLGHSQYLLSSTFAKA